MAIGGRAGSTTRISRGRVCRLRFPTRAGGGGSAGGSHGGDSGGTQAYSAAQRASPNERAIA